MRLGSWISCNEELPANGDDPHLTLGSTYERHRTVAGYHSLTALGSNAVGVQAVNDRGELSRLTSSRLV
jgi:hypothetical protein